MAKSSIVTIAVLSIIAGIILGRAASTLVEPRLGGPALIFLAKQKLHGNEATRRKRQRRGSSVGGYSQKRTPHNIPSEAAPKSMPSGVSRPKVQGQIDI
jgi:hypothetical protein